MEDVEMIKMTMTNDPWEKVMSDLGPCLQDVAWFLAGTSMDHKTKSKRAAIRRQAVRFVLWEGRLYRRGERNMTAVVSQSEQTNVLYSLHHYLGHLDGFAAKKLILDRFWWLGVSGVVVQYVETCDACQIMQTPRHYKKSMYVLESNLLEFFSINFAGPFPKLVKRNRFLLVCVKHLTG